MPINIDGKEYVLNGKKILLFPISKLSQALTDAGHPRDVQILRKWEKWGVIPPAVLSTGVKKKKRLFTKEQIEIIVSIAVICDIKQGSSLKKFSELVWRNLKYYNKKAGLGEETDDE